MIERPPKNQDNFESASFSSENTVNDQGLKECISEVHYQLEKALSPIGESGILQLPDNVRIIRTEYPLFEQQRIRRAIEDNNLGIELNPIPIIRGKEEIISSSQFLIDNPERLKEIKELATDEALHFNIRMSEQNSKYLQLQNTRSSIDPQVYYITNNLQKSTLPPQKKVNQTEQTSLYRPQNPETQTSNSILDKDIRLGPCSYMVISLETISLNDPKIIQLLELISRSSKHHCFFDTFGNIAVIALNEKAMSRLSHWGKEFEKISNEKTHILFGKGNITEKDSNNFVVENYLSRTEIINFYNLGLNSPGIYATKETIQKVKNSRDETIAHWVELGQDQDGLSPIAIKYETRLKISDGPDCLIGYEQEYDELRSFLTQQNKTRLMFLEGKAGSGKSTLIHEVVKDLPNIVKISIDPSASDSSFTNRNNQEEAEVRNIPGFSLVDFIDQLSRHIKKALSTEELSRAIPSVKKLLEISQLSENDKLREANKYTDTIAFYCVRAINYLEEIKGNVTIVLDDAHHIDRYSDPTLMNILGEVSQSDSQKTKIIIIRRPEKRYESISQDSLKHRIRDYSVTTLQNEDGTPKLNLKDPNIAYNYVLHYLPKVLRTNPENNQDKVLGNWPEKLGKMADTPFALNAYLKGIVNNIDEYLIDQKERIDLTAQGERKLEAIKEKEIVVYMLERIQDELKPQELEILQAFALIGQKMADQKDLILFLNNTFNYTKSQSLDYLKNIEEKGYLARQENMPPKTSVIVDQITYRFWHENIRDIIMNFTLNEKDRAALARRIYQSTNKSKLISNDQRFQILNYASAETDLRDTEFWKEYTYWGTKALNDAEKNELSSQCYETAELIINGLKSDSKNTKDLVFQELLKGRLINPWLNNLQISALFEIAKHGHLFGQYETVYRAIESAQSIYNSNPLLPINIDEYYKTGFETAYMQGDLKKLKYYFEKVDQEKLSINQKFLLNLRYNYRNRKFNECKTILSELENKDIDKEIFRLRIRIELEDLLNDIAESGIDGDAILAGLNLTDKQQKKVKELSDDIILLKEILRNELGTTNDEQKLPLSDELQIMDMEGQLCSLSKDYSSAIRHFGEAWRITMQLKIPKEAVRAAKQKGDVEVFKALTERETTTGNLFYRQKLISAIHTYTEDGLKIAEKINNPTWKFILSIQRLRATCMLLHTFDYKESVHLADEIKKYFELADEDIKYINQKEWAQSIPKPENLSTDTKEYELCYYITPLVTLYQYLCDYHEHRIPEELDFLFIEDSLIQGCLLYASSIKNDDLGEKERKTYPLCLRLTEEDYWPEQPRRLDSETPVSTGILQISGLDPKILEEKQSDTEEIQRRSRLTSLFKDITEGKTIYKVRKE